MTAPAKLSALLDVGQPGATAAHEASHAVVASVLDVGFAHVTLAAADPAHRGAVVGLDTSRPATAAAVLLAGIIGELAVWRPDPAAGLVACVAEAVGITVGSGHVDYWTLARIAPDIAADPGRLADLHDLTERLVATHSRAIGDVAAALLYHPAQTLTAAEVAAIMRRGTPHRIGRSIRPVAAQLGRPVAAVRPPAPIAVHR